jgi:hypothetical protein
MIDKMKKNLVPEIKSAMSEMLNLEQMDMLYKMLHKCLNTIVVSKPEMGNEHQNHDNSQMLTYNMKIVRRKFIG